MSAELVFASVAISLALFFYTWGVFGERRGGTLSLKYVLLFWIGLACDTTGTLTMSNIASQSAASGFGIHAITGVVAIVLMLVHALWATFTYKRGSQQARRRFHTFSTVVWLAWLVPYIIGMLVGIPAIHLQAVCAMAPASSSWQSWLSFCSQKDARRMIAAERVAAPAPTRFRASETVGKIAPLPDPIECASPNQGPPAKMPS